METVTIKMILKKSTKGTHVYEQTGAEQGAKTIPSVYIRRTALPTPPPTDLVITVGTPE